MPIPYDQNHLNNESINLNEMGRAGTRDYWHLITTFHFRRIFNLKPMHFQKMAEVFLTAYEKLKEENRGCIVYFTMTLPLEHLPQRHKLK